MCVYKPVLAILDSGVPACVMILVSGADAEKAYSVFMTFKDVVKMDQVSSPGPAAAAPSSDSVGAAGKKLSHASYPFLKPMDLTSGICQKLLPSVSAKDALKAAGKAIVVGAAADGGALRAAAEARRKASGGIDAKGVTSAAGYEAVSATLVRVVVSVPTPTVMGVYSAFAKFVPGTVSDNMFSSVEPQAANAATKAFCCEFNDVVKAAR
ncbi:unnamed protein product [Prorocentrum cordatum]|uniref:Uncharacterized protein n=1 Tax=Prorocentrum cordatum TaxID=2364126 RepID=A0ABN9YCT3_9DINO|nr:unnamed protein product [Polarella glacialis]